VALSGDRFLSRGIAVLVSGRGQGQYEKRPSWAIPGQRPGLGKPAGQAMFNWLAERPGKSMLRKSEIIGSSFGSLFSHPRGVGRAAFM